MRECGIVLLLGFNMSKSEINRRWYRKHKEEVFVRNKKWRDKNQEKVRGYLHKTRYGLVEGQYQQMQEEQKNLCAICCEPKRLDVDHDKHTGRVRGLLCRQCNMALGLFKDNCNFLKKAIEYLPSAPERA